MSAVSGSEPEHVVVAPGVRPPLAVPRRLLRMRSDVALAERFAAGDEAAFDVIYERHRPVVLAVCMGVLGAPADAEDATQETFSALAVALRTRPPAELRPWLIRVARNASIDTTRRRRHRLLTIDGEIPEVAARPASSGKAELAVVLDGIRELPEGQRMALLMRELGGHSYSEIADFLDTDEESVKGLIARARVGLRSYREATELSCSSARATIAAEPDGRRYDKTIRRHLRTCGSCRSYRAALRDDAKALRAALPIQAGTVATGGLSGGMLTRGQGLAAHLRADSGGHHLRGVRVRRGCDRRHGVCRPRAQARSAPDLPRREDRAGPQAPCERQSRTGEACRPPEPDCGPGLPERARASRQRPRYRDLGTREEGGGQAIRSGRDPSPP